MCRAHPDGHDAEKVAKMHLLTLNCVRSATKAEFELNLPPHERRSLLAQMTISRRGDEKLFRRTSSSEVVEQR